MQSISPSIPLTRIDFLVAMLGIVSRFFQAKTNIFMVLKTSKNSRVEP